VGGGDKDVGVGQIGSVHLAGVVENGWGGVVLDRGGGYSEEDDVVMAEGGEEAGLLDRERRRLGAVAVAQAADALDDVELPIGLASAEKRSALGALPKLSNGDVTLQTHVELPLKLKCKTLEFVMSPCRKRPWLRVLSHRVMVGGCRVARVAGGGGPLLKIGRPERRRVVWRGRHCGAATAAKRMFPHAPLTPPPPLLPTQINRIARHTLRCNGGNLKTKAI
jgi:hypothetical protein